MKWDSPQFILTVMILCGFAATVLTVLFVPLAPEKIDLVKSIMTSMGSACLLAIGYFFGPNNKSS